MATTTERIFFIGGTGNVGTKAAQDLLAKDIPVTFFARNPTKVAELFPSNQNIKTVQGDLSDVSQLKEAFKGHTRLFLVYNGFDDFAEKKGAIAKLAYEAGIQQIVDISSMAVNEPWRTSYIGTVHMEAEKAILDIPQRGSFVALRPGRFMSNLLTFDRPDAKGFMYDTATDNLPQGWISPNDIGAVAAAILSEDIKKHADSVYDLIGDVVTPTERATAFSRTLGRPVKYQRVSALIKYDNLMKTGIFSHSAAFNIATIDASGSVTPGILVLLRREPETLEQFLSLNKAAFA